MTSEEVNRAIEFLIQHSADVSVHIAKVSTQIEQTTRGLNDFRESTAQFQAWAAEVVAIQSSRLDQNDQLLKRHDQLHQDALDSWRQALNLLHRILDKLPEKAAH